MSYVIIYLDNVHYLCLYPTKDLSREQSWTVYLLGFLEFQEAETKCLQ